MLRLYDDVRTTCRARTFVYTRDRSEKDGENCNWPTCWESGAGGTESVIDFMDCFCQIPMWCLTKRIEGFLLCGQVHTLDL